MTQLQLQVKEGRQISVDKTLSLILGIINELHVTAVKWVGKKKCVFTSKIHTTFIHASTIYTEKILWEYLYKGFHISAW